MTLLVLFALVGQTITPVASAVYSGADRKLVVVANRLYSACERGLDIFDITQPESIRLLGRFNTPGIANGIAVRDTFAYVADNYNGLLVLSVADPTRPRLLSTTARDYITDVALHDTLALVGGNDLAVFSLANPAQPQHISTLSGVSAYRLAVKETLCFVAAQAGLLVVSIADPAALRLCDTLPTSWLRDVEVKGDYLYCAGDTELLVFDTRTLVRVGKYDAGYLAFGVGIGESLALICRGQQLDIRVLNIANPAQPVYRGSFTAQNGPQDAVLSGSWGFVGVWSRDLLCADLSRPAAPVVRGRVFRPGELNGAWRDGNLVVTADRWYGVSVVDVTNITQPVERGHCTLSGWPRRLIVQDTIAYVANYDGLACVGISNPDNPHLLGQVATPYYTYKLALRDTFAYVAEREWNPYHGNLHCISVADPRNPRIIGTYSVNGGGVEAVAAKVDAFAYVVSQGWEVNEFAIINVRNPSAPFRVSGCNTNGYPVDVDVSGDYAYALITSPNQRIEVISVADTLAPTIVAEFRLTRSPIALYVRHPYLFVSYYYYGIEVFDISDPLNLRSLGSYNTTGNSFGMFVDPELYCYLADGHSLEILRFTPTGITAAASSGHFPAATIYRRGADCRLANCGRVQLIDASGRVVRTGKGGQLSLKGLAPGVYLVQVKAPGRTTIRKLIIQ